MSQYGGGNCSLCGSPGTNRTTCPLNPNVISPNFAKHPLAKPASIPIPVPITIPHVPDISDEPGVHLPDVPLDIIMSYLDKKSLISASRVNRNFNCSAQRLLKVNSIVKNGNLLPLATLKKMASNGNEDAMVFMASTFQLSTELFTYPVFRRCIPALIASLKYDFQQAFTYTFLLRFTFHSDPAISKLATKIFDVQPQEALNIKPEHPIYIPLYRLDTSVAVYGNELFDIIRKWLKDLPLWTPNFPPNLAFLKIAYLFCSAMNTIHISCDQMYSYLLVCCFIVMTYSVPLSQFPQYLYKMTVVEFVSFVATVLAIAPPIVDLTFPNLPDYFGNPQSQEQIDNCNFILNNVFNGIFAPNGIDMKLPMEIKPKKNI